VKTFDERWDAEVAEQLADLLAASDVQDFEPGMDVRVEPDRVRVFVRSASRGRLEIGHLNIGVCSRW
jgi:hypothetical protein